MGIAESMKSLTEDILISYDTRVKALGGIVADTHKIVADARKTVKGFATDRKKMSVEQAEVLGNYGKDLAENISNLLKEFGKNRKHMSEAQAKSLTDFVKDLTKKTGSMLNGFGKDRKEMSEDLKDKLTKEVKGIEIAVKNIVGDAQSLITGYRSDMTKARRTWQGMAASVGKSRETGEKITLAPVEETKKKGKSKKRGRKKGKK